MNLILEGNTLPKFSSVDPQDIEPMLTKILDENYATVERLLANGGPFTWENLMSPLEAMDDRLSAFWSVISHLNAVKNSDALREAYNACLPKLSDYAAWMSHNQDLYQAVLSIADSDAFEQLDVAQQKVIKNELRDFRLAGVSLSPEERTHFAAMQKALSQLTTKFEENVLDATHGWIRLVTDESQLAGLPDSAIQAARETAEAREMDGWLFSLEFPSYRAVMTHAQDREFRREMHYAYATRASDAGPQAGQWDNSQVMHDILNLRREMAMLLGFEHFSDLSLATKMAGSVAEVNDFLESLLKRSLPRGKKEFAELEAFARKTDQLDVLQPWDLSYYSEKLKHALYDISQESLRAYFPVDRVLSGLFKLVERLYDIHIIEEQDVDVWDERVRFFSIDDANGQRRGQFYLDLYARSGKRSGAWMDECRSRRRLDNGEIQIPVAHLVCNFSRPVGGKSSLLTHEEVLTLFHEFGHGLQHMLTQVAYAAVSGISGVCWDAVELPSQFMENWCWQREVLGFISQHVDTGEALPPELYDKMLAARHFQSAMQMVRQLEFSLFDFRVHTQFDPARPGQIAEILAAVRAESSIVPLAEYDRFQHGFSHIFAGGYAAGYYGYKWSEVLSCDAFARFEEEGLFDAGVGQDFLACILETGGAEEPMDLFKRFRGREPKIDALLHYSGIEN